MALLFESVFTVQQFILPAGIAFQKGNLFCSMKSPSFAVTWYCLTGASSLNAEVKAFDSDEDDLAQSLSDARIRIDTILEMREPLALAIMTRGVALADENVSALVYALCRHRR